MRLNEDGFPNYLEVNEKFDLDHNKELAEYIKCMYDVHYKLQHETFNMSPEKFAKHFTMKIKILLKSILKKSLI